MTPNQPLSKLEDIRIAAECKHCKAIDYLPLTGEATTQINQLITNAVIEELEAVQQLKAVREDVRSVYVADRIKTLKEGQEKGTDE